MEIEKGVLNPISEELIDEISELLAEYYTGDTADGLWFCIPFHGDKKLIANILTHIAFRQERASKEEVE